MQADHARRRSRRRPRSARRPRLLIATWSRPARACSMSAAATARCCELLADSARASTGAASSSSQRGVNACVARGLSVIQGDADRDLVDYPDDAFDYVDPVADPAGDAQPAASCWTNCCASADRAIVSFPNFGHWRVRAVAAAQGPHAGDREPARSLVRHAQHPSLHHPRLRRPGASSAPCGDRAGRGARRQRAGDRRVDAPGGSGTCSASRRCSCCAAAPAPQPELSRPAAGSA